MFKKGELTTQQIVILIILVVSFAVILFFLLRLNLGSETDQEICHNSVITRGKSILPVDTFPLQCKRQYVCLSVDGSCEVMTKPEVIKVKTKDEVYKALADQLAECWWMFGEGKVDYISSEALSKNYCSICSQISFDNSVKSIFENKSFFDKKEFYSYLSKNKISDEQTYENYFLINGILNYPGKFGEVDLSKQYYSLMGITSKVSKVGWVLGGALALGALASIPLTGGVSVIAIGTAVGGAVVGGSAGWIASSYLLVPSIKGPSGNFYIPPSVIEVTSSEFDSLNCDEISTSS